MENTDYQSPEKDKSKDKEMFLNLLRMEVERGSGIAYEEFQKLPEKIRFRIALKHFTTTKKAVCEAYDLKVEGMCREKRKLEDAGKLVEVFTAACPVTGFDGVAFLSTNTSIIESIQK